MSRPEIEPLGGALALDGLEVVHFFSLSCVYAPGRAAAWLACFVRCVQLRRFLAAMCDRRCLTTANTSYADLAPSFASRGLAGDSKAAFKPRRRDETFRRQPARRLDGRRRKAGVASAGRALRARPRG